MTAVVKPTEWLEARKSLLEKEKELTRAKDALAKERQQLPMVELDKRYTFTAEDGSQQSLRDLFDGRRQLVVYHFMLPPGEKHVCHGCSFTVDQFPTQLEHLHSRDTTLVLVSRAPIEEIVPFKKRMGWTIPWFSSYESDFNYDFHVSLDPDKAPVVYNFRTEAELRDKGLNHSTRGEQPGLSAFIVGKAGEGEQKDGAVYHTYSTYGRGTDDGITYALLDATKLGRQDEKYPYPVYFKLHDKYGKDE